LNPSWAPQLRARLTYYDIEYEGRIASPSINIDYDTYIAHSWPLPLDRSVTIDQLNAMAAQAAFGLILNYTTLPGRSNSTLEYASILLDGRPTNTAVSRQRGIDADIAYEWALPASTLQASLKGNYLLKAEDQFSPVMSPRQMFGLIFLQARFKGRAGLTWGNEAVSVNLGANYVSSNRDDRFLERDVRVGSWLTYDASVQYRFGKGRGPQWLDNARLTLSAQNLLDRDPPLIVPSLELGGGAEYSYVAYDSANADPYGRWMSIQLTKEW
jgi:iron complex outermembrane receptor protein